MSTMSKIPGILFILVATSVALLVIIVLYSQEQIRQQSNINETERIVKVNQLASRIDLIITNAEKILENAAKDENIKNSPYISSLDKKLLYGFISFARCSGDSLASECALFPVMFPTISFAI